MTGFLPSSIFISEKSHLKIMIIGEAARGPPWRHRLRSSLRAAGLAAGVRPLRRPRACDGPLPRSAAPCSTWARGTDVVFKDSVKVMTVSYNTHGELGEGARKFVCFNIPQIQYKNPWVQIMMFKNMTLTPFLRFYFDSGEQVLVDMETKSNKQVVEHIKKILGKNEETSRKRSRRKISFLTQRTLAPESGSASVRWRDRCPARAWCRCPRR